MADVGGLSVDALNQTARIEPIYDNNGQPYADAWIEVVSIDSARYREAQRKANQMRLDRIAATGRPKLNADELENEAMAMLVACTTNWGGWLKHGAELSCTEENVRWLYQVAPWIREQVNTAIAERRNFSPASLNGSLKQ